MLVRLERICLIGERLSELRLDTGLTQEELAKILKINKHSISLYERNKSEAPDSIKILISKYFNVSVDYLVGVTANPCPPFSENHGRYFKLPDGFPREGRKGLQAFAEFITYK